MTPRRTLILGAGGQLGRALTTAMPQAHAADRSTLDITDAEALAAWDWTAYDVVVNAAAHTAVDAAETAEGRAEAWAINATAPAWLATLARDHGFTLVHYSTDYVFDGTREHHDESEPLSPLGVYGQSKAAGDLAVAGAPRHYVIRTSWVVGDGPNFVRTMESLAERGVSPAVVDDQVGRLTFTGELARATQHLLAHRPRPGVYHVTNDGPPMSWCEVAREVFALRGRDASDVAATTTTAYAEGKDLAPRPTYSTMCLDKIRSTGFDPEDAVTALRHYLAQLERP